MRSHYLRWLVAVVLACGIAGGLGPRTVRLAPGTVLAHNAVANAGQPDLALQVQCGPDPTRPLLTCTFTVTNVGSAPLVTTQATPVVLDAQLTVAAMQRTTVQAALSELCPYNSASLTQVGTNNLAMVSQNGTSNDLTITQTGQNNFATVNQLGNINVLVLQQTSTATSLSSEAVHVSCGGATFAVGQSVGFTVSVGTCSEPAGAPMTITGTVSPPSGAGDTNTSDKSFAGMFSAPTCTPPPPAMAQPTPIVLTDGLIGSVTIHVQGCGTTQPPPGTIFVSFGQSLTITALPCPGWRFTGWSDSGSSCDGGTMNPCTITFPPVTQITATFSP
jgi:hypothetical protein